MTDTAYDIGGVRVLECAADGPILARAGDVSDFISAAWGQDATLVAVPVQRLGDEFFRLRTGLAGEAIQKFVNYRIRLAIVGDIARFVGASAPLRDFVIESNRGDHVWFVPDMVELAKRLVR
jgi:Domain of unknown function (DUF4180)